MIDEKLTHSVVKENLYVHDAFASMFRGMLNWFQDGFDQRFNYKVMATYDKAVQFFNQKRKSLDGNNSTNILPSITIDPNLDFQPEDRSGKFPWMFKELDSVHGRYFARQIDLKEQGVTISVMTTRYSGTCEVTFWLQSIYELMDIRTKLIQNCNGTGRWIRPDFFWTHVIIPKELVEFKRHDGEQLDWSAVPLEVLQLTTTNSKEYGISYPLNAIWRLDSLSDNSTKYGADQLTEWKFTATFTWECNIPTFIRLDNYSFYDMHPTMSFGLGPVYSSQPLIDKISAYDVISDNDIVKETLSHRQIYHVADGEKPFAKLTDDQCDRFPTFFSYFNHIVSGSLLSPSKLKELEDINEVPDNFILLIDRWDESYIKYARKANGVINKYDDDQSEFYTFVSSINLPSISNISDSLYNALCNMVGSSITMDPVCCKLYKGVKEVRRILSDEIFNNDNFDVRNRLFDYVTTHDVFNDAEFKFLNFGDTQFIVNDRKDIIGAFKDSQQEYKLPVILTETTKQYFKLFVNDHYVNRKEYELYSDKVVFKDDVAYNNNDVISCSIEGYTRLVSIGNAINYHMTKEDEKNYITKGTLLKVEIPNGFSTDIIKCCSYTGTMNEHTDFELSEDKKFIIFKIEPQRDKIIQVFMNRK